MNMVEGVGTNRYSYTVGGQLYTEDGPFASDTVTNIYSSRLRVRLGLQQPSGLWTNAFSYDMGKRVASIVSPAGEFDYQYRGSLPSTLVKKLLLPNTSYITNTYDGNARLLGTWLKNSGNTTLDSATYVYNAGNQRTWFTNAASTRVNYIYDKIGQLKVGDSSVNSEDRGYTYDAAWNLNYRTNNGTLQTFKVNGLNELTNAVGLNYTYDGNGNLTSYAGITCTYDDENRLTLVSDDVNHTYRTGYVYDGLGRLRVRQQYSWQNMGGGSAWVATFQWRTVYDGRRVIQDRYTDTLIAAYTWGSDLSGSLEGAGGIGGLLARTDNTANTHAYYHADGNGNVTYLETSAQGLGASYRYDAYGNTLSSSGSLASANVYRFSSKEIDPNSGLYYYGYRWYAPNLQRWLTSDPLGEAGFEAMRRRGGNIRGDGPNLYLFANNNPMNKGDRFGLSFGDICQAILSPLKDGWDRLQKMRAISKCLDAVNQWKKKCLADKPNCDDVTDAFDYAECLDRQKQWQNNCIAEAGKLGAKCNDAVKP